MTILGYCAFPIHFKSLSFHRYFRKLQQIFIRAYMLSVRKVVFISFGSSKRYNIRTLSKIESVKTFRHAQKNPAEHCSQGLMAL